MAAQTQYNSAEEDRQTAEKQTRATRNSSRIFQQGSGRCHEVAGVLISFDCVLV